MYAFNYSQPNSLSGAVAELANEDAKALAGGQTLIPTLKQRLASPSALVDLGGLKELSGVSRDGDSLVIGAHAGAVFILTRSDVTTDSEINESIKRMNHAGIAPTGILFNDLKTRTTQYEIYNYGNESELQLIS